MRGTISVEPKVLGAIVALLTTSGIGIVGSGASTDGFVRLILEAECVPDDEDGWNIICTAGHSIDAEGVTTRLTFRRVRELANG